MDVGRVPAQMVVELKAVVMVEVGEGHPWECVTPSGLQAVTSADCRALKYCSPLHCTFGWFRVSGALSVVIIKHRASSAIPEDTLETTRL